MPCARITLAAFTAQGQEILGHNGGGRGHQSLTILRWMLMEVFFDLDISKYVLTNSGHSQESDFDWLILSTTSLNSVFTEKKSLSPIFFIFLFVDLLIDKEAGFKIHLGLLITNAGIHKSPGPGKTAAIGKNPLKHIFS